MTDDYLYSILASFEESADETLPVTGGKRGEKIKIPRWKEDISPLKEAAFFWKAIWISAGKPINTSLHSVMKNARNKYHLQIRRNKRMLDTMKRNQLLQECIKGDSGLFNAIKRMRKCSSSTPNRIDGETNDIPQLFAKKYENLYNSCDDKEELETVSHEIKNNLNSEDINEVDKITEIVVEEAANRLKGH